MDKHKQDFTTFKNFYDQIEKAQDKTSLGAVLLKLFELEHSHDRDVLISFAIAKEKMLHFLKWKQSE